MFFTRRFWLAGVLVLGTILPHLALPDAARACPFCAAVSLTFSEEIGGANAAVVAKLVKLPEISKKAQGNAFGTADESGKATFEIVEILKGEKVVGETKNIEVVYFGDAALESTFLVMGIDGPPLNWGTPILLSERARKYISSIISLPKEGVERIAFFQTYLEDKEDLLSRDAYDEFAKVPFSGVRELKDRMNHDQVVAWVTDQKVPVSRRRLYLTMLGVCGTPKDADLLEGMIRSDDRQTRAGLDALVAAYLTLKGPDGMPLVEDLFLKNPQAEYVETYAVIMALRFHGQEEKVIPRERLLQGLRLILERPQLADLVIPDLARWEDWSSMDRLVTLFKNSDDESSWVRVPVINYLRACPLPAAKAAIEELAKIDPDAVKRANTLFPFGGAAVPKAAASRGASSPSAQADPAVSSSAGPKTADGKSADANGAVNNFTNATAAADQAPAATKSPASNDPVDQQARGKAADDKNKADDAATTAALKKATAAGSEASGVSEAWKLVAGLVGASIVLLFIFLAILRGGRSAVVETSSMRQTR
jgi:hypothetical protein